MSGLMNERFRTESGNYMSKPTHNFGVTGEPDKELNALTLKLEAVNKLKDTLSVGRLNIEELSLASFQVDRLEGKHGTVVRLESNSTNQENLLLRCEGIVGDISEQIKKFFDWLLSFFDDDDEKPVKRETTEVTPDTPTVEFEPPSLNGYFSWQSEDEATKQISDITSNLGKLESFVNDALAFNYIESLKKGKEVLLKEHFTEIFSKLKDVVIPKDDKKEAFKAKGFALSPKVFYVFEATETTVTTGKKVKLTAGKDIKGLELPKALVNTNFTGKLAELEFKIVELRAKFGPKTKAKISEINKAGKDGNSDPNIQNNYLVAGKLVKLLVGLWSEIRNLRKALKGPLDMLEAKKIGEEEKAKKAKPKKAKPKVAEEDPKSNPNGNGVS